MQQLGVTRREFIKSMRIFAVAPLAISLCGCTGGGSSSSSKTAKCPFCGKTVSQSTLDWQGMCDSCNNNREQANELLDSAS